MKIDKTENEIEKCTMIKCPCVWCSKGCFNCYGYTDCMYEVVNALRCKGEYIPKFIVEGVNKDEKI